MSDYGCELECTSSGCKINIARTIKARNFFGLHRKKQKLSTQIYYGGEGKEVKRNTINKVRSDLRLDENYGIDSGAFYSNEYTTTDDFIIRYRKTLSRLSKL